MTTPRVSVVLIFYNAAPFLRRAIESVAAQSYRDWQLVLVDDGSTDGSTQIAREAVERFPHRIAYCCHPGRENRGMSASRNLGVTKGTSEFVAFQDADDIWLPQKLEEQVELLDDEPTAGMVYGRAKAWYSWDPCSLRHDHFWPLGVLANQVIRPPTLFRLLMENQVQSPIISNALIRRSVVQAVGGFEDRFRAMYEDAFFFSKVHLKFPSYVSDQVWSWYRQHPASCTAVAMREDYAERRLPFLRWLGHYLACQSSVSPGAKAAYERELWRCRHPRMEYLVHYLPRRARCLLRAGIA